MVIITIGIQSIRANANLEVRSNLLFKLLPKAEVIKKGNNDNKHMFTAIVESIDW